MNAITALKTAAKKQSKDYEMSLHSNTMPGTALNVPEYLGRCIAAIKFGEYVTSIPAKVVQDLNIETCEQAIAVFQNNGLWPTLEQQNDLCDHIPSPNAVNLRWRRAVKEGALAEGIEEFSFSFDNKTEKGIRFTLSFNRDVALLLYKICSLLQKRAKAKVQAQDENVVLFENTMKAVKDGTCTAKQAREVVEKYKASNQAMPLEAYEKLQAIIAQDEVQDTQDEVQSEALQKRLQDGPKDEDDKFAEYCKVQEQRKLQAEQREMQRQAKEQEQARQAEAIRAAAKEKADKDALIAQRDRLQDTVQSMQAERNVVLTAVCALQELSRKREKKLRDYDTLLAQMEEKLQELSTFIQSCK